MKKYKTEKIRPFLCIDLLNTFSSKELEGLSQLLTCRYFNTDEYVIRLLDFLKRQVLNKKVVSLEVQLVMYNKVFGDKPAIKESLKKKQKGLLNTKMNLLLRLAEKFLSIEALDSNSYFNLLFPKLIERQQTMLINRHKNKLEKNSENKIHKSEDHYYTQFKLASHLVNHTFSINKLPESANFANLEYNLDIYYLLQKLLIQMRVLSIRKVQSKTEYDFKSLNAINHLLELPKYANHPLIAAYKANLDLLDKGSLKSYIKLINILDEQENKISPDVLRAYYTNAANFCIEQVKRGNKIFNDRMFEVYQTMHSKNLLVDNNIVDIQILKNIVTMACRNTKFRFATSLISYYEDFLPKLIKNSVCQFLHGLIAFTQKDFDVAHDHFIKVEQVNLNYNINTKILILKCLYEKEREYNEYTMTAFRSAERFFKLNKQLPRENKKGFVNFIKILITLYRIRFKIGSRTLNWIMNQLHNQEVNSDANWLKEKIEDLKMEK